MNATRTRPGDSPPSTDQGPRQLAPPGARRRLAALALDLALAAALLLVGAAIVVATLVVRTDGGSRDVQTGESLVALAMLVALAPTWFGWMVTSVASAGHTPGQRLVGISIRQTDETTGRAGDFPPGWHDAPRRQALHPHALVPLLSVAALPAAMGHPWWALVGLLPAAAVAALAAASAVLVLRTPGARALHDRVARTTLCQQ